MKPTLSEARLLWWLVNTTDRLGWRECKIVTDNGTTYSGDADWGSLNCADLCNHGLSAPRLLNGMCRKMIAKGWLELDRGNAPSNVIALPKADWTPEQKYYQASLRQLDKPTLIVRRLSVGISELGRSLAPKEIPYPWYPALNRSRELTRNEAERQARIARLMAAQERRTKP